jgi:hypothetical protein
MIPRRLGDIEFLLLRSGGRRTADIVLERDGRITVRVPPTLAEDRIEQLVEQKRYWIYKNLAEWRDLNATRVVREFRNGEGFYYLGSSYRLALVADQSEELVLKDGRFRLRRDLAEQGDDLARAAFRAYYTVHGQERIRRRVADFLPKVGVQSGACGHPRDGVSMGVVQP